MDFKIETKGGNAEMTFEKADSILGNVFLSLAVPKGGFFAAPEFGSRLHELQRAKNTAETAKLVEDYIREALRWLLDTGRAVSVDVVTQRAHERINYVVTVLQADGREVTFENFVEVI